MVWRCIRYQLLRIYSANKMVFLAKIFTALLLVLTVFCAFSAVIGMHIPPDWKSISEKLDSDVSRAENSTNELWKEYNNFAGTIEKVMPNKGKPNKGKPNKESRTRRLTNFWSVVFYSEIHQSIIKLNKYSEDALELFHKIH